MPRSTCSKPTGLFRDDPTIDDHLGDLYFKTGDLEKAQEFWMSSVNIGTEPEEIQKCAENWIWSRKCSASRIQKWTTLPQGRSFAKINLALSVLGRRTDGYHDIQTIFQAIS